MNEHKEEDKILILRLVDEDNDSIYKVLDVSLIHNVFKTKIDEYNKIIETLKKYEKVDIQLFSKDNKILKYKTLNDLAVASGISEDDLLNLVMHNIFPFYFDSISECWSSYKIDQMYETKKTKTIV